MMNSRGDHLTPIPDAEKEAATREVRNAVKVHVATPEERAMYGIKDDAKPRERRELTFAQLLDAGEDPQALYNENLTLENPFHDSHSDNKRFRKCLEAGYTMPMLCKAFGLAPRSVFNKIYTWGLRELFVEKNGIKMQAALDECEKLIPVVDNRLSKKRSKSEEYPDRAAKRSPESIKVETEFKDVLDNGNFGLNKPVAAGAVATFKDVDEDGKTALNGRAPIFTGVSASELCSAIGQATEGAVNVLNNTFDKLEKLTSTDWKSETVPVVEEMQAIPIVNVETPVVHVSDSATLSATLQLLKARKKAVEYELKTVGTVIDYVSNMMEACK